MISDHGSTDVVGTLSVNPLLISNPAFTDAGGVIVVSLSFREITEPRSTNGSGITTSFLFREISYTESIDVGDTTTS